MPTVGNALLKKLFHETAGFAVFSSVVSSCFFAFHPPSVLAQAPPPDVGYRDFNFGTVSTSEPTSEKPQSKLWWNDGLWWGGLWNPTANRYEIHRFDLASQNWITTGTAIDIRSTTKADALWDGQYLYVASMRYAATAGPATATNAARLYRFSYNSSTKIYTLDSGFPVNINSSQSEALVLDKDSTGKLWITWVEGGKVMINRSTANDQTWGTPFILPVQGNDANSDDISTLVAFGGGKVGVMWSNQNDSKTYFAVHNDGDADDTWQPREAALEDAVLGAVAEDHINLKAAGDGSGAVYATTVSNLSGVNPGIFVLKRDAAGVWTRSTFAPANLGHTRPILVINHADQRVHVFARSTETGPAVLYTKSALLNDLVFPAGLGTPIIQNAIDTNINNPTSTKQALNNTTGMLVLASDRTTHYYLHNFFDFTVDGPQITSFSPSSGPIGTQVTITGENFSSATKAAFNGVTAASFTIDSDTQLRATVPTGASNGVISITNAINTGTSANDYLLTAPPVVSSFAPSNGPAGAEITIVGNHFASTTSVAVNGTEALNFIVDSDTQLRVIIPTGATTGKISVTNPDGEGLSVTDFIVTLPPEIASFTPANALVGTVITVSGNNFAGVSAVAFNGTSASFNFDSNTQIRATLPSGATTGKISITNSAGVGLSATDFVVRQILNVTVIGSGTVSLDPSGGVYDQGTAVTVTALPAEHWEFNDWDQDLDGAPNPATLVMNSNKNVRATFTAIPQYTVTTSIVGSGTITLDPPGGVYYRDTIVTLTSTPDPGYVFSGWSGDFKGWMNIEQITITSNKSLTATFSPLPTPLASGLLTNANELSVLPATGMRWERMKFFADLPNGAPNLSDQDDSVNVRILAKALIYARTGQASYRNDVIAACMSAIGTEQGVDGRTLALGRELVAYVIAADLVGLPPAEDATFRAWLGTVLTEVLEDHTLRSAHEIRANNWGTHCGASRAAIARYLGDATELERTARVFKGWLGDRNTYTGFSFDELDWQANPATPVGINPQGAMLGGQSVDGVLPDDQRRSGGFSWPPPKEDYVYGALQGALVQAIILHRAGYDVWNWENQALLRAVKWLYNEADYPPDGDDEWVAHIIDHYYDEHLPAPFPASPGKNAGWTDWLYGGQFSLTMQEIGDGDFEIHSLGEDQNDFVDLKISAIPDVGAEFINWAGSLSGTENPDTLKMNSNKSVTINFSDIGEYVLTVNKVGQGNVATSPPNLSHNPGTVVTLTALPASGFQFSGWSGDLTGSTNPTTITMTGHKTVTAIFTSISNPQYILTVNAVGSGSVTLNPPGGVYDSGTVVTLTANPAAGFQFTGWSGDLTGSTNPTTITMSAAKSVTATFTPIQYSLSVNAVGSGSVTLNPPGGVYDSATVVTLTANPSAGFQFTGWSGDLSGSINPTTITMSAAKSVTATFTPIQYSLSVNAVGSGSVTLNPPGGVYDSGTVVTLTANPSAGFQFTGWSGDLTGSTNPTTITMSAAKSVTATFTPIQYSLSANAVGSGSVTLNPPGGVYDSGTVVTLTANPSAEFQFTGWSGDLSGSTNPATITMNSNRSVTATFTPLPPTQFILTTNVAGSGSVTLNPPGGVYDSGTVVTLTANPAAGFQFTGWSGDLSGSTNPTTITMNSNRSVTATFTPLPPTQFTLTTNAVGSGSVSLNPPGGVYDSGTVVTLTANPSAGFQFTGWSGDLTGSTNPTTITMSAAKSVTATFTPIQYSLSVNAVGSGSVTLNPPGGIYDSGTVVTLTANPAAGFQFTGWSGDLSGSTNPTTITMSAAKSVTATFTPIQYSLSVNAVGSGSVTLNPPGGIYDSGTVVTLTANPSAGFQFTGWSGDLTGSTNPTTITMSAAKSVTATFTPIQYSLSVNAVGSGSVTLNPPGGVYDTGTVVTLTANPAAGFQFTSWSGDLTGSTNPTTITMDANKSATATFTPIGGSAIVTHEETKTGGSSNSTTAMTSASVTGVSGHLYLAAISSRPRVTVTSVSGLGLTWTLVKAQCSGRNLTGIELWIAQGSPSGDGTVIATLSSAPKNAAITVSRYSGVASVNPVGNIVSANSKGVNGACSGGKDGKTYSFNLATTVNGAVVYGSVTMRNRTHTPGAGYTERAEIIQGTVTGDMASVAVEDKTVSAPASVAVNGTFNATADWAAVAVEIKPQTGGAPTQFSLSVSSNGSGSVSLNPPGGVYDPGTVVTLTANPAVGFQFTGWSGDLTGVTNPATITMNSNKSVTATFTETAASQFTLTANTSGSGSVTLNPPGGVYDTGAVVTLTANPAVGFQFTGWSGDLSGVTNPTTMTMNANKSVTATFTPIGGGGGAVTHEETKTGGSSSSNVVATSAVLNGVSGNLYLASIASRPRVAVASVSGLGLNWTLVKAQCSGRNATGVELWMAQGTPTGSGAVTATFSSTTTNAVIAVSRYSGIAAANPVGNIVSGNTTGTNGACSGGTDNSAYSFNLPVTMNGAIAYSAATMRSRTHTPGAGYTEEAELLQGSGGDAASIAVEDKSVASAATVTVNGTFSGSIDWAVVTVEIKPQAAATIADQNTMTDEKNTAVQSGPIDEFSLEQNYPNPFNAGSTIEYALPAEAMVRLRIYNTFGQLVRTLVDETQQMGRYRIIWNGRDDVSGEVGAGVYLLRLEVGSQTLMRKMTMIK